MVTCAVDNVAIPIDEAIELWTNIWIKKEYDGDYFICGDCDGVYHHDDQWSVSRWHETRLVCESCRNDNYFQCHCCNERYHDDYANTVEDYGKVCDYCRESWDFFTCNNCWCGFHIDYSNTIWNNIYCNGCYSNNEDDDSESEPKDGIIEKTSVVDITNLPEQVPYNIPEDVQEFLSDFYDENKCDFDTLYKYKDIDESSFISHDNEQAKVLVKQWIWCWHWNLSYIYNYETRLNQYKDILSSKWVDVTYEYIDVMWKKKTRVESIMSIWEKFKRTLGDDFSQTKPDKKDFGAEWFTVRISNDNDHKLRLAEANDVAFSSCQIKCNRKTYSRWIHDWFLNWCNIPVSIMQWDNLLWRQLCRLMLDEEWNEYLFLDRLYTNSSLSDVKAKLYVEIAKRLNKTRDLAIPRYSEHDNYSVYDRLRWSFNFENWKSLRTPSRKMNFIRRWYYHDSKTRTYENDNRIYDKIYRDNCYIIKKATD